MRALGGGRVSDNNIWARPGLLATLRMTPSSCVRRRDGDGTGRYLPHGDSPVLGGRLGGTLARWSVNGSFAQRVAGHFSSETFAITRISCISLDPTFRYAVRSCNTRATAATARATSCSLVCQLHTDTRMQRFPRHVVLLNSASPLARTALVTASVHRSWSLSVASGRGSRKRTRP